MYMSDTLIIANSIWPNGMKVDSDGYAVFYPLGTNKIEVPTETSAWPQGNKLISPYVFQDDKLVGFCDTKAMTVSDKTSITLNYEHIEADFSSIEEGMLTITAPNAITAKYIWANSSSSDTGNSGDTIVLGTKYLGCTSVEEMTAIDPDYLTNDIVDGVWSESLADLGVGNVDWTGMFYNCQNLTTFTSDLSSLTDGTGMFGDCSNLTTFSAPLSSLVYGMWMFQNCTNLTSFNSDLSSLADGMEMFSGCKLDTASIQNIADTINATSATINIGIGNSEPNEQEDAAFKKMASKGWYVYTNGAQYTPTSPAAITTLDENGEEITTPIPFWAKPVSSDEQRAKYVDAQGNFFNILGGQFIYGDDLSTYGMFTCEADAAANMRLTPYTKPQTEIENQ